MAGRLMAMEEESLAHGIALGAARAATPGIVRAGHISAAKSIANALVAQSGVQGALLAAHGATGPLAVLESVRGMQELFAKGDAAEILSAPFPDQPYIMRSHVKMYPCLGTGQSAVAAGLALHRQLGQRIAEIERIEVVMSDYPMVKRQQEAPERIQPTSREAADHSFTFLTAVSLIDGSFGLEQYEKDRWFDPQVTALMDKLVMTTDAGLTERAPGAFSCLLRARTRDGQEHVAEVLHPPGYSRGGLDQATIVEKFHAITKDSIDAGTRDRVIAAVLGFATAPSPDALMSVLRL
jgi:2-methylcitrate dehydratase